MNIRESVEALMKEGKTYSEISLNLGITKSCVYWHANEKNRQYARNKRRDNHRAFLRGLRERHGGKCKICGYAKFIDILQFHHTDPSQKDRTRRHSGQAMGVTDLAKHLSQESAKKEADLCILLCPTCHAEQHVRKI